MFLLNTTNSNRTIIFLTFLFLAGSVMAQESQKSSLSDEMEDSLSTLAIIPLKPGRASKVFGQVFRRYQKDQKKMKDDDKYLVSATFRQDSLASFTAQCVVSPYAGMDLFDNISVFTEDFVYDGQYELTRVDSTYIRRYLKHFARMSPTYVPMIYTLPGWNARSVGLNVKDLLYPLLDYNMTMRYYNYSVSRIEDSKGRRVYRIVFGREKKKKQYTYGDNVHDVGEVTGTAYFDGKTMRLMQFKGKARRPTDRYDININYRNDYEDRNDTLVLKRTIIAWKAEGAEIRARVMRQD